MKRTIYNRIQLRLLRYLAPFLGDESYVKLYYLFHMLKPLDLENPQTYNEKLQWLKLHDKRPEYTQMVDKIAAKEYVASIIGDEYIIPTIAIYEKPEDIDFDQLPNQFVLKVTHDSGGIVVCKNKQVINKKEVIKKMEWGLKRTYYKLNREYPYKDVPRRIIAEQYMEDESGYELKDYKIFCFDGKPKLLFVATDRQIHKTKFDFFDLEWNHLPFTNGHPNNPEPILKPKNFEKMLEIAAKLSKGIPHVRVDLYNINGKIYFGEMTFFHWSGIVPFVPEEWDYKIGDMLNLPTQQA
ncbi:MAG: glycosyl transferase [Prevotella sp.]|nr:glycosyl transferase [Prevotella sp.]